MTTNRNTCISCGRELDVVVRGRLGPPTRTGWPTIASACEDCARTYYYYGAASLPKARPCENCGIPVIDIEMRSANIACSHECRAELWRTWRKERAATRREKRCPGCGLWFDGTRSDAKYCSSACRQKAYRQRKRARRRQRSRHLDRTPSPSSG